MRAGHPDFHPLDLVEVKSESGKVRSLEERRVGQMPDGAEPEVDDAVGVAVIGQPAAERLDGIDHLSRVRVGI